MQDNKSINGNYGVCSVDLSESSDCTLEIVPKKVLKSTGQIVADLCVKNSDKSYILVRQESVFLSSNSSLNIDEFPSLHSKTNKDVLPSNLPIHHSTFWPSSCSCGLKFWVTCIFRFCIKCFRHIVHSLLRW